MKEDNQVLLVSESSHDMQEIVASLKPKRLPLQSTYNAEAGKQVFERDKPAVLLLNLRTLESAESYCEGLSRDPILNQVIVLCTMQEAQQAAGLTTKGLINDYFIFKPINDPHYLGVCVQHALDRVEICKELSESQANLKAAEDVLKALRSKAEPKTEPTQSPEEPPQKTEEKPEQETTQTEKPLILIIGNDSEKLESLEKHLDNDFVVLRTTSRIKTVVELHNRLPDLILMELALSGIDGIDLAQQLKQNERYKQVPILLIFEGVHKQNMETALRSGVDDLIIKPIKPKELHDKIRAQLERYQKLKRRKSERYTVRWQLNYHRLRPNEVLTPSKGVQTFIVNISDGGAAILPVTEVLTEEICVFAIHAPGHDQPFLAIGELVWVKSVKETKIAGARWLFWKSAQEKELVMEAARSANPPSNFQFPQQGESPLRV